ncbi:MAG: hypothetical protein QOH35_3610, partial [Acidobacteriaceae bacterium]|nr:hypothetical protein [Acidobacteriaceae bacterium]
SRRIVVSLWRCRTFPLQSTAAAIAPAWRASSDFVNSSQGIAGILMLPLILGAVSFASQCERLTEGSGMADFGPDRHSSPRRKIVYLRAARAHFRPPTNDEKPMPPKIHSLEFDNVIVQLQALPRSEF